jgi:hypothetical protein
LVLDSKVVTAGDHTPDAQPQKAKAKDERVNIVFPKPEPWKIPALIAHCLA